MHSWKILGDFFGYTFLVSILNVMWILLGSVSITLFIQVMSSPTRKRQKLSSPKQPSIETIPISSESEDEDKPMHIPFIQVEDISDDEKDVKPSIVHTPLGMRTSSEAPSSSSAVNSPMKMLSQANIFDNIRVACTPPIPQSSAGVSSNPNIEVSKADSQSNVISTTTMLSPFSTENRISTLGSPRYMVQEISSTVVTHKRFLLTGLNKWEHDVVLFWLSTFLIF